MLRSIRKKSFPVALDNSGYNPRPHLRLFRLRSPENADKRLPVRREVTDKKRHCGRKKYPACRCRDENPGRVWRHAVNGYRENIALQWPHYLKNNNRRTCLCRRDGRVGGINRTPHLRLHVPVWTPLTQHQHCSAQLATYLRRWRFLPSVRSSLPCRQYGWVRAVDVCVRAKRLLVFGAHSLRQSIRASRF